MKKYYSKLTFENALSNYKKIFYPLKTEKLNTYLIFIILESEREFSVNK